MKKQQVDIIRALKKLPKEATLQEILEQIPTDITNRTLQRHLNEMIESEQIIRHGSTRAARYSLGKIIYNREFLDAYIPNKTFYLDERSRSYLDEISGHHNHHKPAGTYARKIYNRLLIDLSWNSSRLEGNSYSLLETKQLIEYGEVLSNKPETDAVMILNHKAAIEFIIENINEMNMNSHTICNIHALLSSDLIGNNADCGRLRQIAVGIGKTPYQPLDIPQLISELFRHILDKASRIHDPFEQAFFIMVHIPYLQPFVDVNKRTSRLAANIPFIKNNFCPLSFVDVANQEYINGIIEVYEFNQTYILRDLFISAYEKSTRRYSQLQQTIGESDSFRIQYRSQIQELVSTIVTHLIDQKTATGMIQRWANANITQPDRSHFIESVETELLALHKGNIARYKITQKQYQAWRKIFVS